jgi:hypothetical protein
MYLIGAATTGVFGFLYFGMVDTAIPWVVFDRNGAVCRLWLGPSGFHLHRRLRAREPGIGSFNA